MCNPEYKIKTAYKIVCFHIPLMIFTDQIISLKISYERLCQAEFVFYAKIRLSGFLFFCKILFEISQAYDKQYT